MKNITLRWWQAMIYETAMISLGLAIGVFWSDLLRSAILEFLILGILGGIYIYYFVWWRQVKQGSATQIN